MKYKVYVHEVFYLHYVHIKRSDTNVQVIRSVLKSSFQKKFKLLKVKLIKTNTKYKDTAYNFLVREFVLVLLNEQKRGSLKHYNREYKCRD